MTTEKILLYILGIMNSVLPLPQFKNTATKAADFWNPQNFTDDSLSLPLHNIPESYTKGLLMVFSMRVPAHFKLFQNQELHLVSTQEDVLPGLNLTVPNVLTPRTTIY